MCLKTSKPVWQTSPAKPVPGPAILRRFGIAAIAALCLAGALPAAADGEPSAMQQVDEIVVTAPQPGVVGEFVAVLAEPGPTNQLAQWRESPCPDVVGLVPAQAEKLRQRIVEAAASVRLSTPKSKCAPSVVVMIAENARGTAAALADKYAWTLRKDGDQQLKRFVENDQPVRWIGITDPCGFGCSLQNSRIRRSTTPIFSAMLIVVDAAKIAGYGVEELADYVALVVLANPSPGLRPPLDSILSLFDRAPAAGTPASLTRYDQAFLHALYEISNEFDAQRQRDEITAKILKELAED